jgi:hypothetical protein
MQPTQREGRRPARLAASALFAAMSTLILASVPASAQIDIGDRWILLTGKWSRGTVDAPAWLDLSTWTLAVQVEGSAPRVASDPPPLPWVPVAGDFNGDGVDSVLMFDPATWRLVRLEDGPVEGASDPQPNPWVPVAGDWDGRGFDTVRVFDLRDGSLHALAEGPIPVERYEPDPNPWRPLAGDFTGRGLDTVALSRDAERTDAGWVQVAGDWDGDGIDTVGAMHIPSGELVAPVPEELASRADAASVSGAQGPASLFDSDSGGGCSTFTKNFHQSVKMLKLGAGACMWIVFQAWEEWTCCPLPNNPNGLSICGVKWKFNTPTKTGAC